MKGRRPHSPTAERYGDTRFFGKRLEELPDDSESMDVSNEDGDG